ncbi:MAG: tRNA (cytidine(56)-2'-O)-methyltransferase [Candidatus Aenigmatarchaeota archaeon]
MSITILRIGHRHDRDARISTHCGLVARALGADKIIYGGEKDESLLGSVKNVAKNWGGPFKVEYAESWRKIIRQYTKKRSLVVHLTMYGLPIQKEIDRIRKKSKKGVLIIIGAEKVPGEVYRLADYNIAVANQPHSEVASLAIFLHEIQKGRELTKKFKKAKLRIIPMAVGKKVKNVGKR